MDGPIVERAVCGIAVKQSKGTVTPDENMLGTFSRKSTLTLGDRKSAQSGRDAVHVEEPTHAFAAMDREYRIGEERRDTHNLDI